MNVSSIIFDCTDMTILQSSLHSCVSTFYLLTVVISHSNGHQPTFSSQIVPILAAKLGTVHEGCHLIYSYFRPPKTLNIIF